MRNHRERGQALLLFAFLAPVVLGMLALVLDVGWAHFIGKRAQTAADAAALAAVADAAQQVGNGTAQCGSLGCQASTACPSTGNLETGCSYAAANGFPIDSAGNRTVTIAAGTGPNAPGVSNVPVD